MDGPEEEGGPAVIVRWLVNTVALLLTAWLVPGIGVESIWAGLLAALVLGVVNAIIRPVLLLLTLPLNVLTLGLFTLVINGLMLWLVSAVVPGFSVSGFWSALVGAVVLSVVSFLLSHLIP
jgi:putative membrane protein